MSDEEEDHIKQRSFATDNPAEFDQIKARARDMLRDSPQFLVFVETEQGFEMVFGSSPGVDPLRFVEATVLALGRLLGNIGVVLQEEEEEGDEN